MPINKRVLGKCLAYLGIEDFLRSLWYRIFGSKITRTVCIHGKSCSFHCPTPMVSDSIASANSERQAIEWFLSQLHSGNIVWDVGANVGLWTVFAAHQVGGTGKVVAFEPLPAAQRFLRANLKRNSASNVVVRPEALGDQDGAIFLYPARAGVFSTSSLASVDGKFGTTNKPITVALRSGASVAAQEPSLLPDAIKLDVEGAEQLVIQGLGEPVWKRLRVMMVEVHPDMLSSLKGSPEEVRCLIESHSFRIVRDTSRRNTLHWLCVKQQS